MKLSVCVDAVFQGVNTCESMERVKEAGLDAVEFWSWWDKDMPAVRRKAEELQMRISAFCTRFISLTDPAQRTAFLTGLRESVSQAKAAGCPCLIAQTGADTGEDRQRQRDSLIAGLRACAPILEGEGVTLAVEPLNVKIDHPGYFLVHSAEAFDIVAAVGSPRVRVLYDLYHQQVSEGDILRTIEANLDKICHFHLAGVPGRHEPDSGELCYPNVFRFLRSLGCSCYAGLEYFPQQPPAVGLRWAAENLSSL